MSEKMQYRTQVQTPKMTPHVILHGGAGNINPSNLPIEKYHEHRNALLGMISRTNTYMMTPLPTGSYPSALQTVVFAVTQLEDNPLFNAGHGAVFTRDGINECEASIMVSRGYAKRTVGVLGLQHVRNPIKLAAKILEHGNKDLAPKQGNGALVSTKDQKNQEKLNIPSAQGHTMFHGRTAEQLAADYGLDIVPASYFFTQKRWDEHIRGLEREKAGFSSASYSEKSYLPQGTTGAVAVDSDGVIAVGTSTGGLTNKLTGRLGDTPTPGAGFWAEEWVDDAEVSRRLFSECKNDGMTMRGISLARGLAELIKECLGPVFTYQPVMTFDQETEDTVIVTRSIGTSGTGNGDSFLRIAAGRTVGALAQFKPMTGQSAISAVSGPCGKLQQSAGDRFRRTGEGEGGMIGIESVVVQKGDQVIKAEARIVQDHNCGGMFRAWIDDDGKAVVRVFRGEPELSDEIQALEMKLEDVTVISEVGDHNLDAAVGVPSQEHLEGLNV